MKRALITLVSLALLVGYCEYKAGFKAEQWKAFYDPMSALVEDCNKKGSSGISIRGKCLVLDLELKRKSDVHHDRLPIGWKLSDLPSDKKITVLMINGKRNMKVGIDSKSSRLANTQYDIAVAYWPEKKPVGFLSIVCKDARTLRLKPDKIDIYNPDKSPKKWIEYVICGKGTITEQEIVNDVSGLIKRCRSAGKNIKITDRKALVWDMHNKSRSSAHKKLIGAKRASSDDNRIAVFMIFKRDEIVGTYSISKKPAIRQHIDIAVAYWPEKKPVGFYSVVSKDPRSSRPVEFNPEYGDPDIPIAEWIESVVKIQ